MLPYLFQNLHQPLLRNDQGVGVAKKYLFDRVILAVPACFDNILHNFFPAFDAEFYSLVGGAKSATIV